MAIQLSNAQVNDDMSHLTDGNKSRDRPQTGFPELTAIRSEKLFLESLFKAPLTRPRWHPQQRCIL